MFTSKNKFGFQKTSAARRVKFSTQLPTNRPVDIDQSIRRTPPRSQTLFGLRRTHPRFLSGMGKFLAISDCCFVQSLCKTFVTKIWKSHLPIFWIQNPFFRQKINFSKNHSPPEFWPPKNPGGVSLRIHRNRPPVRSPASKKLERWGV